MEIRKLSKMQSCKPWMTALICFFGNEVPDGIESLAPDAGPPEKILQYLSELDTMTQKMTNGSLGMDPYQWLRQRNSHYSRESYYYTKFVSRDG